ncbi:hypothetical protein FJ251_08680 [bacterium]|nr:hypothetical protein [bacterium]
MVWRRTVGEFARAMLLRRSYDPRRNLYLLFGFVWGLPIPLFSIGLGFSLAGLAPGWRALPTLLAAQPWQLFFLIHPLLFGAIFGILGSIYALKEDQVARLLRDLRGKVRELGAANRELQELDKLKDEFLSNVTHELKTPLVTIQGYSEMLDSGRLGEINDRQRRALAVMRRNQERLQELIRQLLRYGKLEESTAQVFMGEISVVKLLRFLEQSFLPAMEQKGVDFRVIPPDPDVHVMGQEDLIEQALRNLIGNARKFTEPGGRIAVSVDASEAPARLGLVVEDSGCGIAQDALPFIFERFRQGDGSIRRKYGGTGLGLAIVKKIADAHRATVKVESTVGRGSRFTIVLPIVDRDQERVQLERRRQPR